MKFLSFSIAVLLILAGCANPSSPSKSNTILAVGYVTDNGGNYPVYWKNGLHLLPLGSSGATYGVAANLLVKGTDVYIGGWLSTSSSGGAATSNTSNIPVYWKNGQLNLLPLPSGATYGNAWSPFFDGQGNLYFQGEATSTGGTMPGYWEIPAGSGTAAWHDLMLVDGAVTATSGNADSGSAVYNGDVYFAGWLMESGTKVPRYWKNDTVVDVSVSSGLTSESTNGVSLNQCEFPPEVTSQTILAVGLDTYYAPHGEYIVGGTSTPLPTGTATAGDAWWVNTSPSGDVYAAGVVGTDNSSFWSQTQPAYWKNWQLQTLPLPSSAAYGSAAGVLFSGSDVYINGTVTTAGGVNTPVYWINGGQPRTLPTTGYSGGVQEAWALVDF